MDGGEQKRGGGGIAIPIGKTERIHQAEHEVRLRSTTANMNIGDVGESVLTGLIISEAKEYFFIKMFLFSKFILFNIKCIFILFVGLWEE